MRGPAVDPEKEDCDTDTSSQEDKHFHHWSPFASGAPAARSTTPRTVNPTVRIATCQPLPEKATVTDPTNEAADNVCRNLE